MRRALAIIGIICAASLTAIGTNATRADAFSDGVGKQWATIGLGRGLSSSQIATVCPRDGVNPCTGSIGGSDFTGWVWATEAQVRDLFVARYWAGFATANGSNSFWHAIAFIEDFGITGYFANTYSASEWSYGWTSTIGSGGLPIGVGANWGHPPISGGLGLGAVADVGDPDRGTILWRADGSGGTAVDANDDYGAVDPPTASVAVVDVLANDMVATNPATVSTVTLTTISASPGVSLDPSDGAVHVAAGTNSGSKSLVYRICEIASPTNCDTASVNVVVTGNVIDAVADSGSAKTTGGAAVADVLANDRVNLSTATIATVTLTQLSGSAGLSLDVDDGSVDVAAGTSAGTKTLSYRICEIAAPFNCDTSTVTVAVQNLLVNAVNDTGSAPSTLGGVAVSNVLANDRLDGAGATLSTVTLAVVSTSDGVSLDANDGSVDVAAGTTGGTKALVYRICEAAMPSNCAQATVSVSVAPQAIVVSNDRPQIVEGTTGTVTVRLSQQPAAGVVVAAKFYAGTTKIVPAPATLTFTPVNWNVAQTLRLPAKHDSNEHDAAATINLTAPGVVTKQIIVTVRDDDRPAGYPVPTMTTPLNGQTVSGVIAVSATASDPGGAIDDVRYYIKGVRLYSGPSGGTVNYNTTALLNGWNVIEVRATDTLDNESRLQIKVFVQN